MRVCLSTLDILEEISKQNSPVAKMQDRPGNSRRKDPWFVSISEPQRGLKAKTAGDVWVVHEFVLIHSEVAVNG